MKKNKKNILITGARGFIGKNLIEHLLSFSSSKYSLFYPYHSELDLLDCEKVQAYLKDKKIDTIVHCANTGGTRKTAYDAGRTDVTSNNLRMFFNLAHCLNSNMKLINLGTGAEYSIKNYKPKMPENYFDKYVPEDAYGFSKYICSKFAEKSSNIVSLRLFGVYGKYEDYEYKFISNSIVRNLLGLPIVISQNVLFDFSYINDLVKIIEYFIKNKPKYNTYNLVTGKPIDLITIAKNINDISLNPSKIVIKHPGLNTEYSGSNIRLLKEIGNFTFTPINRALKNLYSWYKDNINKIDKKLIYEDKYIQYCRVK
ncbi:MAG: NAD(P)-dependent oxidoreductase [Elusimicrobia bacterium]|nr:NAD(P)-dependent oxidoreductase [Elusimicrobiota bacterium]